MQHRRLVVLVVFIIGAGGLSLFGQENLPFPQYLEFRGEYNRAKHASYEAWAAAFEGMAGGIRKFLPEELTKLNPQALEWSRRWKSENPDRLMLLHFNGEARQVSTRPEVQKLYFPGHWVYLRATRLNSNLSAEATTLTVDDSTFFRTDFYRSRNDDGSVTVFPTQALLVSVNSDGSRRFAEGEFVELQTLDRKSKVLTVKRGQYGTVARFHGASDTVVLPLAGGVWGGSVMWFYNLAQTCPRDAAGKNAGEVLAEELAAAFRPGGQLAHLDGIAGDVNYWFARPEWDVDNDGLADGGFSEDKNLWKLGDQAFQKLLRKAVGDKRFYISDAGTAQSQQAVGLLNGFESEGLVSPKDAWRGFSQTVNTHLYWQTFGRSQKTLRYIVPKLNNPDDAARSAQLRRLAWGTACVLGAWITAVDEPYLPEALNGKAGVLGQALGPLSRPLDTPERRLAVEPPEVLAGILKPQGSGWVATAQGQNPISLSFTLPAVPAGDFTVYLDVQALDSQEFPSLVTARSPLEPELFGLYGSQGPFVNGFTWRQHPGGPLTITLEFPVGPVFIRELRAVPGADVLLRRFERATVVVNPGLSPALGAPPLDIAIVPQPQDNYIDGQKSSEKISPFP